MGFLVALLPHVAALLFGRYALKMNPVILILLTAWGPVIVMLTR